MGRKKAEKEAAKTASLSKEDKFDAFGNKIEEKQAKKKIPKSELKKIKKRVADLRKKGQEVWTDEEIEKEATRCRCKRRALAASVRCPSRGARTDPAGEARTKKTAPLPLGSANRDGPTPAVCVRV